MSRKSRRSAFGPNFLGTLHKAMEEAWIELSPKSIAPEDAERLRKLLARKIMRAAIEGEQHVATIKEIGLKGVITDWINRKLQYKKPQA